MKRARDVDAAASSSASEAPARKGSPNAAPLRATEHISFRMGDHDAFSPEFAHNLFEQDLLPSSRAPPAPCVVVDGRSLALTLDDAAPVYGPLERHLARAMAYGPAEAVHHDSREPLVGGYTVHRSPLETAADVAFHRRAEALAPFFIETADAVDLDDPCWEAYYAYAPTGEFCGYTTVYRFRNPVRGVVLRVCQMLVLPTHQRRGIGGALFARVFSDARADPKACEVTVEDPCPGFSAMRLAHDLADVARHAAAALGLPAPGAAAATFAALAPAAAAAAAASRKMTAAQLTRCREAAFVAAAAADGDQAAVRLAVKRRLLREHREDIDACRDKLARQQHLNGLWRQECARYVRALRAAGKRGAPVGAPPAWADAIEKEVRDEVEAEEAEADAVEARERAALWAQLRRAEEENLSV